MFTRPEELLAIEVVLKSTTVTLETYLAKDRLLHDIKIRSLRKKIDTLNYRKYLIKKDLKCQSCLPAKRR